MRLEQYLNESKSIIFVRYGGLSKIDQKKYGISQNFHKAPANKGIFAFTWPYIEDFLWAWKVPFKEGETEDEQNKRLKKFIKNNRKKFTYSGWIWTHFENVPNNMIKRRSGSWIEIHTSDFQKLFKKQKHTDMKGLDKNLYGISKDIVKDPYKRGLGGFISRDHLEVFIEKIN